MAEREEKETGRTRRTERGFEASREADLTRVGTNLNIISLRTLVCSTPCPRIGFSLG